MSSGVPARPRGTIAAIASTLTSPRASASRAIGASTTHSRPVGDVDLMAHRGGARAAQLARSMLVRVAVTTEERNPVSPGRELAGDTQADTRRRPGDDRDPAQRTTLLTPRLLCIRTAFP